MIPIDHHGISMQGRRASLAVSVLDLHIAEILFPGELSIDGETVDPPGAEGGDDMLPVGYRGVGCPASGHVGALVRPLLVDNFFPKDGAVGAVDRQDHRALVKLRSHVVMISIGVLMILFRCISEGCR